MHESICVRTEQWRRGPATPRARYVYAAGTQRARSSVEQTGSIVSIKNVAASDDMETEKEKVSSVLHGS